MSDATFATIYEAWDDISGCCPVCGSGNRRSILTAGAAGQGGDDRKSVVCMSCETICLLGDDPAPIPDPSAMEQGFWHGHVQSGADIVALLGPLLMIGGPRGGDLLDVGCGFGFVPDFWQKTGLGQGVGLERGPCGRVGGQKLGAEIIDSSGGEARAIAGRSFDCVYGNEVIDRFSDPAGFIREIGAALKPNGILVLTVPCADRLAPETGGPTEPAALGPGRRWMATRPEALEGLLRSCGFPQVLVRRADHHLYCWASRVPLPEISESFSEWDPYFTYLDHLSRNSDPHVSGGALYRLLRDSMILGRTEVAERAYPFFEAEAKVTYGIDFRSPDTSVLRAGTTRPPADAAFPSWTGCGYLFAGKYLELEKTAARRLVALYSAAVDTMQHEIGIGTGSSAQSLRFLPLARESLATAQAKAAALAEDAAPEDCPLTFAKRATQDFSGKEVCLFVTFVPGHRLLPGAIAMVEALVASGVTVVVCCAVNDIDLAIDLADLEAAACVVKRRNGGYDFAVWAAALAEMPEIWSAERLFFANDSILGPLDGFGQVLGRIRDSDAAFVALTESFNPRHHSQSFFFVLQNAGLRSPEVRNFWRRVRVERTKQEVIDKYEIGLLPFVRDVAGLETEILFPFDFIFQGANFDAHRMVNPTHQLWKPLIHRGFPFVKAELLFANPLEIETEDWETLVASHGGDVAVLQAHLKKMEETRGPPPRKQGYQRWKLLRWIIGDERFREIRRKRSQQRRLRRKVE